MNKSIHINCDMGESYGRYTLVDDKALMPYIDACNIACGFHAGDPSIIEQTLRHAKVHDLEVGAHPSFPDRQGFGRRDMDIAEKELEAIVRYQVAALYSIAQSLQIDLTHVKAHGALYNQAAKKEHSARAVANAVYSISPELVLYAPFGSIQSEIAQEIGLQVRFEAFIDRRYNSDGTLMSRKEKDAVIKDPTVAWNQVYNISTKEKVTAIDHAELKMKAETFCIHGDNPAALDILTYIDQHRND